MNKSVIVLKREYWRVIKKPAFWISTLFFPLFIVIIALISGFSAQEAKNAGEKLAQSEKGSQIVIYDESNILNHNIFLDQTGKSVAKFINNTNEGISDIKDGKNPVFIHYPKDVATGSHIEIFVADKGIFVNSRYDQSSIDWLKTSILANLSGDKLKAYNANYQTTTRAYKDGKEIDNSFTRLIAPIISVMIYFILTTFATSYLLQSVSEEKENRVMEIVLSTIKPRQLITGKILGQVGVVLTQVLILTLLSIGAFLLFKDSINIPIDLSQINISFEQVVAALFYTISSFFILACIMVGVGAAMPSYKDAQSFSSVFIVISVIPFYFFTLLLAEPSGSIAIVLSYFPLTSGIVLLFRNALGALSPVEVILGAVVLILYSYIAVFLAFKLFEFGSLEYGRKISFKEFFKNLRHH